MTTKMIWRFTWDNGDLRYAPSGGVYPPVSVTNKIREKLKHDTATVTGVFDADGKMKINEQQRED